MPRQFRHRADLEQVVRHGLLHVDRNPQVHGADGDGRVHVVGCAHTGDIDVMPLLRQHLAPILVDFGVRILGRQLVQPRRIDLSHARQLHLRMGGNAVEGFEAHIAAAERGQPQSAARRRGKQVADEKRPGSGLAQNGTAGEPHEKLL